VLDRTFYHRVAAKWHCCQSFHSQQRHSVKKKKKQKTMICVVVFSNLFNVGGSLPNG
jgi:hypothetical protein